MPDVFIKYDFLWIEKKNVYMCFLDIEPAIFALPFSVVYKTFQSLTDLNIQYPSNSNNYFTEM